jgi:hypothetical protein
MRAACWWAVAVLLFATLGTGAAADQHDPYVEDACGDADRMAFAPGQSAATPDAERAAGFDVRSVNFSDLPGGGVEVILELCGDVPEPELAGSGWSVSWRLDDSCARVVLVHDSIDLPAPEDGVQRGAQLSEQCTRTGTTPLGGSSTTETTWIELLDSNAWSAEGNTVRWTLTPDLLPAERASRVAFLAPGTPWLRPSATARDGRWLTEASLQDVFGVNGPGARDWAGPGRDFTVGETLVDANR